MFMLKVTLAVFVLASLFSGLHGQKLTCLCTGKACEKNVTTCTNVNELCYAAEIRLQDSSTRIEKGCKLKDECTHVDYCPVRKDTSVCEKFGCCNYDRCVANYTLGAAFQNYTTPTPTPTPSPSTTQKPPMVKSSSLVLEPTSSVVPTTTKSEMAATSSVQAKMAATSTVQAEMTSKPMMPTTKMSAVKPMTSAQPEMKSTGSKDNMMSSSVKDMKATPTGSGVFTKQSLVTGPPEPHDNRPTCPNASGRVFGLGAIVVFAIGLLCSMF